MIQKHFINALLFCWLPLAAQELDLRFLNGLEAKASESTNINLGPEQIQLMMSLGGDLSPELQWLGKNIERVQVKTLEFEKEGRFSLADAEKLRESFMAGNVVSLVSVKKKNGFSEIAMRKGPKGQNAGFVILNVEPTEIAVINIVGQLDLSSLSKLSGKLGVPNIQMGPAPTTSKKGAAKEEDELF
jgi:hypothetical protein